MQNNCTFYSNHMKPNNSSIGMESTHSREPIYHSSGSLSVSSSLSSSDNTKSFTQNRNNLTKTQNSFRDLNTDTNKNRNVSNDTQHILIDEGTIDCLSLHMPKSSNSRNNFNNLNVHYNRDDKSSVHSSHSEEEDEEIDQLRIDEGIDNVTSDDHTNTPTIITNKSLLSHDGTKMSNSNLSSSILDTLISSTNGPSTGIGNSYTATSSIGTTTTSYHTSLPMSYFPQTQQSTLNNSPYHSILSTTKQSNDTTGGGGSGGGGGGFLDRLFTFSPNSTVNAMIGGLKITPTSYQDRTTLFTTCPQKTETLSSPNEISHSNGFSSNLTNSLLSNDESPNFSNVFLNQQSSPKSTTNTTNASVNSIGKTMGNTDINCTTNIYPISNVHSNILNNISLQSTNQGNESFMKKLYSNQIHSSPEKHRGHSIIQSGIQKHTINQKELKQAREKTRNNLKHFLTADTNFSTSNTNQTNVTVLTVKNATMNPSPTTTTSLSETSQEEMHVKLPSPENEIPLKQKMKMRSYKLL